MNKKVNLIRENYTTKNCANCFKINEKITKEKKFECEYCKKKNGQRHECSEKYNDNKYKYMRT